MLEHTEPVFILRRRDPKHTAPMQTNRANVLSREHDDTVNDISKRRVDALHEAVVHLFAAIALGR